MSGDIWTTGRKLITVLLVSLSVSQSFKKSYVE